MARKELKIYTLKYEGSTNLPKEVRLNGALFKTYDWDERGNPTTEIFFDNSGLQTTLINRSFDNRKNPWHSILKEKIGFVDYYLIYHDFQDTGFVFNNFGGLQFMGNNNLISYTRISSSQSKSADLFLEYNEEGYPIEISKNVFQNGNLTAQKKITYKYLEDGQ